MAELPPTPSSRLPPSPSDTTNEEVRASEIAKGGEEEAVGGADDDGPPSLSNEEDEELRRNLLFSFSRDGFNTTEFTRDILSQIHFQERGSDGHGKPNLIRVDYNTTVSREELTRALDAALTELDGKV